MTHNDIHQALRERVLILDGAMGTMLQKARAEAGCIDMLCLSSPETIEEIHLQYLQAGADIITTDTFNANAISLARYEASHLVPEICREAVAAARRAIERSGRRAWIAGDVGPTGKSLSMTADDADTDFDTLRAAYLQQIGALAEAGADLILLETIFDTLNAKAAISALLEVRESTGRELPLMVSATLTESGRLLSGQTLEAFIVSISHARPISIGLNCGFGAEQAV
ncbi:MAG: homocysteine S-methyltransferase family protein, partial [Paramuribaculum sp.]|nr:homocysteine S-methyltransferase family protein [Paramuribaculum sp.]